MVTMTQSLEHWLFEHYRDKVALMLFGHLELFTDEMKKEYIEWCKTDEGKQYLKGGSKYNPEHKGNKALDKIEGDNNAE